MTKQLQYSFNFYMLKLIYQGVRQSWQSGKCGKQVFEMTILRPIVSTEVSFSLPLTIGSGILNLDYGSQKGQESKGYKKSPTVQRLKKKTVFLMCFEFFESIYLVQKQPFFSTDSALSASLIFFFSPIPPSKLQGDLPFMVGD